MTSQQSTNNGKKSIYTTVSLMLILILGLSMMVGPTAYSNYVQHQDVQPTTTTAAQKGVATIALCGIMSTSEVMTDDSDHYYEFSSNVIIVDKNNVEKTILLMDELTDLQTGGFYTIYYSVSGNNHRVITKIMDSMFGLSPACIDG